MSNTSHQQINCFNCRTPAALCNGKCAYLSFRGYSDSSNNKRPHPSGLEQRSAPRAGYFVNIIRSAHNSRRSWSLGQLLPAGYPSLRWGKNVLVSRDHTIACNFGDKLVEQLCSDKALEAYHLTLIYSPTRYVATPRDSAVETLPTAILLNNKVHLLPKLLTSQPTHSLPNVYGLTPGSLPSPASSPTPTFPVTTPYACIWFNTIDVTRPTLFTRDPCAVYNYLSWLVGCAGRAHDLSLIAYCETFAKEFFKFVDIFY